MHAFRNDYRTHMNKELDERSLNFHGAMWVIDSVVGRLYEVASQLERETIFVFTSDNGGGLDRTAYGAGNDKFQSLRENYKTNP